MTAWLLLLCLYGQTCTAVRVTEAQCHAALTLQEDAVCIGPDGKIVKAERR